MANNKSNGRPNGRKNGNGNGARPKRKGANGNGNGGGNGGGGRTMYKLATTSPVRPYAWASDNSRAIDNSVKMHSGSDFVTTVRIVPNPQEAKQRILATFPISPSAFPGTRMTQFSQLYEFYKFKSLRLRYVPAVPVTLACQLVLYVDLDPLDDPTSITNPDTLVRQATAQTGAMQWNFHTPKNIPMAMRTDQQYYYTGEDKQNARFSQQGRAYLIQVTNPVNFNGEPITTPITAGSIYFDWACNFNVPQLNPAGLVSNQAFPTGTTRTSTTQVVIYQRDATAVDWIPSWNIPGTTTPLLKPRNQYVISPGYEGFVGGGRIDFNLQVAGRVLGEFDMSSEAGVIVTPPPFCITTDIDGYPEQSVEILYEGGSASGTAYLTLTITPLTGDTVAFNSSSSRIVEIST